MSCVVLTPGSRAEVLDRAGGAVPAAVRAWAEDQGWTVLAAADPLFALAELSQLHRVQASQVAWGQPAGDGLALLVDESTATAWVDLDAMVSAVRRYLPTVTLFTFNGEMVRKRGGPSPTAPHKVPEASSNGPPRQRAQITQDEIEMLLGRDDQEPGK